MLLRRITGMGVCWGYWGAVLEFLGISFKKSLYSAIKGFLKGFFSSKIALRKMALVRSLISKIGSDFLR